VDIKAINEPTHPRRLPMNSPSLARSLSRALSPMCPVPPVWETWEGIPSRSGWRRSVLPSGVSVSFRRRKASPNRGEPTISALRLMSLTRVPSPSRENALREDGRGIDLAKRGGEVRKLFYAAFARGLIRDGIDPEEALQEVFKGLLSRNRGTCPFDIKKSSFGHYVHIVTRCVLANFVRKEKKRALHETSGEELARYSGESREWEIPVPETQEESRRGREWLAEKLAGFDSPERETLLRAVTLMSEGVSRREAAKLAGADFRRLGVALDALRARSLD